MKLSPIDANLMEQIPTLASSIKNGWDGLIPWNSIETPTLKLWKHDSIESLEDMFVREMSKHYDNPIPGVYQVRTLFEQEQSMLAIKNKLTSYKMEDVSYNINKYGLRGNFDLASTGKSIAFFGCSITFGVGTAEEDCFTSLIGKELGATVYNFGVPAGSFSKSVRHFHLVSQYRTFDYVVFLMPQVGRIERPLVNGSSASVENIAPAQGADEEYRKQLYSVLDDTFLEYEDLKNIVLCVNIAKQSDTKIYFSSWSPGTYNLLYNFLGSDSKMLLPFFYAHNDAEKSTYGRDGSHPGPIGHYDFYKRAMEYINV